MNSTFMIAGPGDAGTTLGTVFILGSGRVATVNRSLIDCGLFPSTRTHGQEGADRGYQLGCETLRYPADNSGEGAMRRTVALISSCSVLLVMASGCSRQITYSDGELREITASLIHRELWKLYDRQDPPDIEQMSLNLLLAKDVLMLKDNPELNIDVSYKGNRSWRSDYWPVAANVSGKYVFSFVDDVGRLRRGLVTFKWLARMRVRKNGPSEIEELRTLDTDRVEDLGATWRQ